MKTLAGIMFQRVSNESGDALSSTAILLAELHLLTDTTQLHFTHLKVSAYCLPRRMSEIETMQMHWGVSLFVFSGIKRNITK